MKTISNPHDKYFKSALSDKSNAVEFFSNYLPQNILGFIDFDTLLLEAVQAKFNHVGKRIEQKINGIDSTEFLVNLLKDIFRIDSLDEFEKRIDNC